VLETNFFDKCYAWRQQLGEKLKILESEAHDGELAAFVAYAVSFPDNFLALIDTYDVAKLV